MPKSQTPKVSIILVNYNGAKDTIECVQSLDQITYLNYEVIIVDNASTDNSFALLKSIESDNVALLSAGDNLGFSGGNNVGIRYALEKGTDYILLLNNDTWVEPNFLDILVSSARELGPKVVLTSKILYAFDRNRIWYAGGEFNERTSRTTHTRINQLDDKAELRREVTFVSGCCMLFSAAAVQEVGELDEKFFLYCEDLEYCCRFRQKGYRLYYEPNSVIYHKVSASTGKSSNMSVYYTVRNKKYIIESCIPKRNQWFANVYNTLELVKRIITKEYGFKAVARGFADYHRKRIGRMCKDI